MFVPSVYQRLHGWRCRTFQQEVVIIWPHCYLTFFCLLWLFFILQWRSHSPSGSVHAVSSQGICNCWRCVCVFYYVNAWADRVKESCSVVLLLNGSLSISRTPWGENSTFVRLLGALSVEFWTKITLISYFYTTQWLFLLCGVSAAPPLGSPCLALGVLLDLLSPPSPVYL